MKRLRGWVGIGIISLGLSVVVIGGLVVKLGAWIGDKEVVVESDLSDEDLRQIYREASEARSKEEETDK